MPKFRTMRVDTPVVATHLLSNPDRFLTPVGGFLRRTSLDELPQLWCILRGQMALVGPRPALFNQEDLIALREKSGVDKLRPGLTGWAQVNGRDALSVEEKVQYDVYYLDNQSLLLDARILILTAFRVLTARDVSH
jgi:O-antigen biosynthesis protein WbqP